MAIAADIPGLQVTIEVAGEALPEYAHDTGDTNHDYLQTKVAKYIEAPNAAGVDFEIRTLYRKPFEPPLPIHVEFILDGNYVQAPYLENGGMEGCEGYKYGKATFMEAGETETRNFCFSALTMEERDDPVSAESKHKISAIGQIVIYFYYVESLEEATPAKISQALYGSSEALSQKAMKATVAAGDSLTCQTSLSAPERRNVTYNKVKTTDDAPFAAFTFYYRSTAALKSLGIIPRTPSPSPTPEPEPKDPNTMTAEELRAELVRMRNEQQQAVRIKREREQEREDSVDTLASDADSEVEWLGTQPSKRPRRGPGEGDEVVDVED